MDQKIRLHDLIAGVITVIGVLLGYFVDPAWLLVPGILGLTLIQSAFTGICPVHYTLDLIEKKR